MAFSHKHRFQKKYGIHYSLKMNVAMVCEVCGETPEVLQPIYDEVFKQTNSESKAMLAVYSYVNHGKVYSQKTSSQNTNVCP